MPTKSSSQAILEREFLPVRAKILEIAASLDRIGRAEGDATSDPRWDQLQTAIDLLLSEDGDRAEVVQLLLSRPYDEQWKKRLDLQPTA